MRPSSIYILPVSQVVFVVILAVTDVVGNGSTLTTAVPCPVLLLLSVVVITTDPAPVSLAAVYVTIIFPEVAPATPSVLITAVPPVTTREEDL